LRTADGKRRTTETVQARPGRPEKPSDLTGYGAELWDQAVADLEPLGVLSRLDAGALAAYCQAMHLADEAWATLRREGMLSTGARGQKVRHPAVAAWNTWTSIGLDLAKTLGLTPMSRLRMPAPPVLESDDDLLD
jgi:P27 family predicted phage terminase small subunit